MAGALRDANLDHEVLEGPSTLRFSLVDRPRKGARTSSMFHDPEVIWFA
jgi:hypothetical protein